MCWVCNVPIDPLKTIKPYKEEVEEILLKEKASEKIHKNDNTN